MKLDDPDTATMSRDELDQEGSLLCDIIAGKSTLDVGRRSKKDLMDRLNAVLQEAVAREEVEEDRVDQLLHELSESERESRSSSPTLSLSNPKEPTIEMSDEEFEAALDEEIAENRVRTSLIESRDGKRVKYTPPSVENHFKRILVDETDTHVVDLTQVSQDSDTTTNSVEVRLNAELEALTETIRVLNEVRLDPKLKRMLGYLVFLYCAAILYNILAPS